VKLKASERLAYAHATCAVAWTLDILDKTMRYRELATAIGLLRDDEKWHQGHIRPITDILDVAAACETGAGTPEAKVNELYARFVNSSGKPGPGYYKTSVITARPWRSQEPDQSASDTA
jgi:hypothetical protein